MHRGKGWDGLAYHFVITNGKGGPDGGLQVSPRWRAQKHGAHAGAMPASTPPEERNAYNEFGIGICLVGNFEHRAPSRAQLKTLSRLVTKLRGMFDIPAENVMGHRHVKSTACPGSHFPWGTLFAMSGESHPEHLYRHPLVATLERCPWCQQRGAVALNRPRKVELAPAPAPATPSGLSTQ
jgi:N-acetyl-anhydromuramyl-L-alanine amidase AmpD